MNIDIQNSICFQFVEMLKQLNLTIATSESLTGGRLADKITNIPGASNVYKKGFIVYSNEAKQELIKVNNATIEKFGAVSKECCEEMCKGTKAVSGTDIAICTTGNAGPDGMEGKEVGLVYIGIAFKNKIYTFENHFKGDRNDIKELATNKSLQLALKIIEEKNGNDT